LGQEWTRLKMALVYTKVEKQCPALLLGKHTQEKGAVRAIHTNPEVCLVQCSCLVVWWSTKDGPCIFFLKEKEGSKSMALPDYNCIRLVTANLSIRVLGELIRNMALWLHLNAPLCSRGSLGY
jgi:hypothetical protein